VIDVMLFVKNSNPIRTDEITVVADPASEEP
jgi:hypothetical protein